MKKSQLRQIIREQIKKTLSENKNFMGRDRDWETIPKPAITMYIIDE